MTDSVSFNFSAYLYTFEDGQWNAHSKNSSDRSFASIPRHTGSFTDDTIASVKSHLNSLSSGQVFIGSRQHVDGAIKYDKALIIGLKEYVLSRIRRATEESVQSTSEIFQWVYYCIGSVREYLARKKFDDALTFINDLKIENPTLLDVKSSTLLDDVGPQVIQQMVWEYCGLGPSTLEKLQSLLAKETSTDETEVIQMLLKEGGGALLGTLFLEANGRFENLHPKVLQALISSSNGIQFREQLHAFEFDTQQKDEYLRRQLELQYDNSQYQDRPEWFRAGMKKCDISVRLSGLRIQGNGSVLVDVEHILQFLPGLRHLSLPNCDCTDQSVVAITRSLPHLVTLNLGMNHMPGQPLGLASIEQLTELRQLSLGKLGSNPDLQFLENLLNLERVQINGARLDDDAVISLIDTLSELPKLTHVDLSNCVGLKPANLKKLLDHCPQIISLRAERVMDIYRYYTRSEESEVSPDAFKSQLMRPGLTLVT